MKKTKKTSSAHQAAAHTSQKMGKMLSKLCKSKNKASHKTPGMRINRPPTGGTAMKINRPPNGGTAMKTNRPLTGGTAPTIK